MRTKRHVVSRYLGASVALLASACGGGAQNQPERLSATEHEAEATRHEQAAAVHQRAYDDSRRAARHGGELRCYDSALPDPTSGGELLRVLTPCWTAEAGSDRHLEEATEDHREAARHRAVAASMRRAERDACRGLGQQEITHSPFFHRDDILAVEELRSDDGAVRGARVVFRKVAGLTVPWMNKALFCHQARAAAAGYAPTVMSYCPVMVAPVSYAVEDRGATIAVTLAARGERDTALLVGRARELVRPGYHGPHH